MKFPRRTYQSAPFWLLFSLAAFGVFGPQAQAETTNYSGATVITALPCTISTPGTYYLDDNLNLTTNENAIHVTAPNVAIDLNGHTISQSYGANINTCGVAIDAQNVSVVNGSIVGFYFGVIVGSSSHNGRLENLCLSGSSFVGVDLGANNALVRRCRILDTGGSPINNGSAYGVVIAGSPCIGNRVLDCDISLASQNVPYWGQFAVGFVGSSDNLIVGNRVNGYYFAFKFWSPDTCKYRDNLISSVSILADGGTNAGNNN